MNDALAFLVKPSDRRETIAAQVDVLLQKRKWMHEVARDFSVELLAIATMALALPKRDGEYDVSEGSAFLLGVAAAASSLRKRGQAALRKRFFDEELRAMGEHLKTRPDRGELLEIISKIENTVPSNTRSGGFVTPPMDPTRDTE